MSQTESSSDSDSNTSSSWVFLDDCTSSNEPEKNKYYLNCSSEPIQELTPQCLDSMNYEQETDSDGISIISESDDAKEHTLTEEPPLIENIQNIPVENVVQQVEPAKNEHYINKYVIIGWIIIAVMTPLLLNYFSAYMQTVLQNVQSDTTNDFLKNDENMNKLSNGKVFDENNIEIPDLTYQVCDYNKNILENKKKRMDSKGEIDVHRLNCHTHQCSQLDLNRVKNKHNGKNKKENFIKNDEHNFKKEVSLRKDTIELIEKLPADEIPGEVENYERRNKKMLTKISTAETYLEDNENEIIVKAKNSRKNKKNHKKKDFVSKSHDDAIKKNKLEKSEHRNLNKKKKNKKRKEDTNGNPDRVNFYQNEIKKLRKMLEYKEKEIRELTKTVKLKDKHLKMLEYKILKELNVIRKSGKKENRTPKRVDYPSLKEKINSTSGEWYHKLHRGRSKLRNQQYASDWVFDRANFRSKKRTMKSNWYWNWMADREQLRLKRGFWQFTY